MHVPPAFAIDAAAALPILRDRGFGQLVVPTAGAPFGVHVPFLVGEGPGGRLRAELHVARANPIHRHVGAGCPALLTCEAGDAYVSPDWYGVDNQVPTWVYVAVHLAGTARLVPEEETLGHVDRLSARFEERLLPKPPWSSAKMDPARRAAMLKGIVVIALDVEEIRGQRKLNQHKSNAARAGTIAGLRGRGDGRSLAIAALMEEMLEEGSD